MKHHVLTVLNDKYLRFGCLLLQSLQTSVDRQRIGRVLVCDVGLTASSRSRLRLIWPDIIFMQGAPAVEGGSGVHSKAWLFAVMHKTAAVRRALELGHYPLVLLDADQFVCGDFLKDIDLFPQVNVTARSDPPVRRDGLKLPYIASTMRFRDSGAVAFVDEWIAAIQRRIRDGTDAPFETPALCEILGQDACPWQFGTLPDTRFSAPNLYLEGITQIVHFKSIVRTECNDFFRSRIGLLRGATPRFKSQLEQAARLAEAAAGTR